MCPRSLAAGRRRDRPSAHAALLAPASRPTSPSIIANGIVVTMDGEQPHPQPGLGRHRRHLHRRRRPPDAIASQFPRRRDTIDATGKVVMPGLINTHTHAPMVLYRGLGDDLALMDWLQKYIFPAEAKTVSPEFVRVGTRLAAARDDPLGHHDLRRHVLLRGGDRARRPRRPGCAACSGRR